LSDYTYFEKYWIHLYNLLFLSAQEVTSRNWMCSNLSWCLIRFGFSS